MSPGACEACLRRAGLVAALSDHIEVAVSDRAGRRASEVLSLPDDELIAALAPRGREEVLERAAGETAAAAGHGGPVWARCRHHRDYPPALLETREAPAVLFGLGNPERLRALHGEACVTVVGARRPSAYGRELAGLLGRELAAAGVAVVSGMALGIDSCAHAGALDAGGQTVAVLGGGPDLPRPSRMRRLHERIADRGLVLSELPPGTEPRRWAFPARNRIMAALGAMTVVVEARTRSGSLITSTMAADLGREVGAVPGQVGASVAAGANALLRDGAQVIRGGQDVLDSLLASGAIAAARAAEVAFGPDLPAELREVLELVERGAATPDAVARASELGVEAIASALTRLELLGYVSVDLSGRCRRTALGV